MEADADDSACKEWSLYADPTILRLSADVAEQGWVALTLETDPRNPQCVGTAGRPLDAQDFAPEGATELASLTLCIRLEEIPHLIAILNEVYRRHYATALASLEFEPDFEFPQRERLPSRQTLTWPVASRLQPVRDLEDWKDRRALLSAFKVLADKLADDVDKLGLLRPIG